MANVQTNSLYLGDEAPNFNAESTSGKINLHDWIGNSWCILFSHPKDFTPVCTTELGTAARLTSEFDKRNTKLIGISIGDVDMHKKWIPDINETQNVSLQFPIIGDISREVATLYGMVNPASPDSFTVRSVFIIDPKKKIRLILTYPASTGRNFSEIIRVLDSLQLTDNYKVATPADWKQGDDCVILPSITNPQDLKKLFPKGFKEIKPYLRITPDPSVNLKTAVQQGQ